METKNDKLNGFIQQKEFNGGEFFLQTYLKKKIKFHFDFH